MDQEVLSPENSLKAIAIMSAIPVVIFALWGDSFSSRISNLEKNKTEYDKEAEHEKIRIAGIMGLLFQFMLFLSSAEIREQYPFLINAIFMTSATLHLIIQSRIEKKLPATPKKNPTTGETLSDEETHEEVFGILLRTAVSWFIGLTLQILVLFSSVKLGLWLGTLFGFNALHTPQVTAPGVPPNLHPYAAILALGTGIAGVAMGFFINYALGPLYLKTILPHYKAEDPELLSRLTSSFKRLNLTPPAFLIINLEQFKVTTLTWVGFYRALGPFRPILAISKWMLKTLAPEELDALVLNQAAHVFLAHSRKRLILTLLLIAGTAFAALGSVFLFEKIIPGPVAMDLIGPSVAVFSFIVSFRIIAIQNKKHEFEADVFTIKQLGVQLDLFIDTLIRVDHQTLTGSNGVHIIHPDTQIRINDLRSYFASQGGDSQSPPHLSNAA